MNDQNPYDPPQASEHLNRSVQTRPKNAPVSFRWLAGLLAVCYLYGVANDLQGELSYFNWWEWFCWVSACVFALHMTWIAVTGRWWIGRSSMQSQGGTSTNLE